MPVPGRVPSVETGHTRTATRLPVPASGDACHMGSSDCRGRCALMRWALGSSLRFWRLVVALAILLMVFGVGQLRSAPVDAYPDFRPPPVEGQTEALGLSAVEVEQLIMF